MVSRRCLQLTALTPPESVLADALDGFVSGMEQYLASGVQSARRHAELALGHGIADGAHRRALLLLA